MVLERNPKTMKKLHHNLEQFVISYMEFEPQALSILSRLSKRHNGKVKANEVCLGYFQKRVALPPDTPSCEHGCCCRYVYVQDRGQFCSHECYASEFQTKRMRDDGKVEKYGTLAVWKFHGDRLPSLQMWQFSYKSSQGDVLETWENHFNGFYERTLELRKTVKCDNKTILVLERRSDGWHTRYEPNRAGICIHDNGDVMTHEPGETIRSRIGLVKSRSLRILPLTTSNYYQILLRYNEQQEVCGISVYKELFGGSKEVLLDINGSIPDDLNAALYIKKVHNFRLERSIRVCKESVSIQAMTARGTSMAYTLAFSGSRGRCYLSSSAISKNMGPQGCVVLFTRETDCELKVLYGDSNSLKGFEFVDGSFRGSVSIQDTAISLEYTDPQSQSLMQTEQFSKALVPFQYTRKGYKYQFKVLDIVNRVVLMLSARRGRNRRYTFTYKQAPLCATDSSIIGHFEDLL